MSDQKIIDALLYSGLDDWVTLHQVVGESMRGKMSAEGKATTLRVIRLLLVEGLMVPGDLSGPGFVDWSPPIDGWLDRCEEELVRLNWSPMGDGPWFRLTEKGTDAALKVYPPPDLF